MSRELLAAVERLAGTRVAVVGDVMLDSYLGGRAGRLCREAPVPIVGVEERHDVPGGAANAAANARQLGGVVRLLGLVGDDESGGRLRESLARVGIGGEDLVDEAGRATLTKQRIIADGQLLVRFDEGTTDLPDSALERRLLEALPGLHAWAQAIVVSDYGYGVVTDAVVDRLAELQGTVRRVLVADAKDLRRLAPLRPSAVKPNYDEACRLLDIGDPSQDSPGERAILMAARAADLLRVTGADRVLVTLDGDGSLLLSGDGRPYRTYARPVSNDHAAGAGDTVAATLGLALASGASERVAVELAAAAAAVAVGKPRTATCDADELRARLEGEKLAWPLAELRLRLDLERAQGRRVVFTNGCFDILHPGHVTYLSRAKALGDVLVVAVNSDDSVRRLKGPGRPVNTLADRMDVLAALASVDYLVAFDEDSPAHVIRKLRPDIVTKGGDYTEETLPEAELIRGLGGEVRILPFVADRSTSRIIERIGGRRRSGRAAALPATGRPAP